MFKQNDAKTLQAVNDLVSLFIGAPGKAGALTKAFS